MVMNIVTYAGASGCDAGCGKDVEFWSNGFVAYAVTNNQWDATDYQRCDGSTVIEVYCGWTNPKTDEVCGNIVRFDLTDNMWGPSQYYPDLTDIGVPIERY